MAGGGVVKKIGTLVKRKNDAGVTRRTTTKITIAGAHRGTNAKSRLERRLLHGRGALY
ncbi:hypothetical protein J7E62_11850 [Variovorax paradoxus]|nr:hypothetical protein [Variovorax paradoxus]